MGGDLLELATRRRSDLQLAENERINFIGYLNQLASEMQMADPDFKYDSKRTIPRHSDMPSPQK